jgi:hypothetical protein
VLALRERLREAQVSTEARNCRPELEAFGNAVASSQAVVSRPLSVLMALVSSSNSLMSTYHKLVAADARIPEANEFDPLRSVVDGLVNPLGVHAHITYGALSLNGRGVQWYGDFSITLKEEMIASRSSVFEENPFSFCDRYSIVANKPLPPGYRATWTRRSELAMAKLHSKMRPGLRPEEFPDILLEQGTKAPDTDFIEVHTYGPIHPKAIAKVIAKTPTTRADVQIWKRVKRDLARFGASVEEI